MRQGQRMKEYFNDDCQGLGRPSDDNNIRLYSQDDCDKLGGNYHANGECTKPLGGSFSWDCRGLNSVAAAAPAEIQYKDLGCYRDDWNRALTGSNPGRPYDRDACGAMAQQAGHKYFSVQDGNECYTGDEGYDKYGRIEGDCPPGGGPWNAHTWEIIQGPASAPMVQAQAEPTPEPVYQPTPEPSPEPVYQAVPESPTVVASPQVDVIDRGLDVQESAKPLSPPLQGWQSMGTNSYSQCDTLRSFTNKTLDKCKEVCLNGDRKMPGNNGCNTINYQPKMGRNKAMCSTHKCADVNSPQLIDKTGGQVFSWFGAIFGSEAPKAAAPMRQQRQATRQANRLSQQNRQATRQANRQSQQNRRQSQQNRRQSQQNNRQRQRQRQPTF